MGRIWATNPGTRQFRLPSPVVTTRPPPNEFTATASIFCQRSSSPSLDSTAISDSTPCLSCSCPLTACAIRFWFAHTGSAPRNSVVTLFSSLPFAVLLFPKSLPPIHPSLVRQRPCIYLCRVHTVVIVVPANCHVASIDESPPRLPSLPIHQIQAAVVATAAVNARRPLPR